MIGCRNFDTGRSCLCIALGFLLLLAGCTSSGPSPAGAQTSTDAGTTPGATTDQGSCGPTQTPTSGSSESADQPAHLESILYGLVEAQNRTAYASSRNLKLRNDSVQVVVELRQGAGIPHEFDVEVESRHENLVQSYVRVCHLVPLSEHENVSFVRSPRRPAPDQPSGDTTDT